MFGTLSLLVAAGLLGPLLGAGRRGVTPVVAGELLGGLLIGRTGFNWIDPTASPLDQFAAIGFAMLMLTAGTHVDLRSTVLRAGAVRGAVAFLTAAVVAVAVGLGLDAAIGTGHAPLIAVLLAGSSAAVALPIIEERGLTGPVVAFVVGWLAVADTVTVVVMPLTLGGGGSIGRALLGDAVIVVGAAPLLVAAMRISRTDTAQHLEQWSRQRGWALLLRLSTLLLLLLATVAERTGASLLVAGFTAGIVLGQLRESERLAVQFTGIANGFFVPLYFVLLGARLDVRGLVQEPRAIALAAGMGAGAVLVHVSAAVLVGRRERVASGLMTSAQLGLPAAAATLALTSHALPAPYAAAIVVGACLTLIPATAGALRLAAAQRDATEAEQRPGAR